MRTVALLVRLYFAGTPLTAGLTALGALVLVAGWAAWLMLPPFVAQHGLPSRLSLAQESLLMALPMLGMLGLLFGAALLPAVVARFAASHSLCALPNGRVKLLTSALLTVLLLAAVGAATVTLYYISLPVPLEAVFRRAFVVLLPTYGWLYVVLWFIGLRRSPIDLLAGSLAAIVTLTLPLPYIAQPSLSPAWPLVAMTLLGAVLAFGLWLAPRHTRRYERARAALALVPITPRPHYRGREVDFIVGTGQPWLLALGQAAPILVATYLVSQPQAIVAWPFFFTIMSALLGTPAAFAAARSRALWLRTGWTRLELFGRIEAALWRHHGRTLGVLVALFAATGGYLGLPLRQLAFGIVLLPLGAATSTYLGLLTTRGIGWRDAVLAVAAMALMLATAVYISDEASAVTTLAGLESALGGLALSLRQLAKRRWGRLDWMLCRPEQAVRGGA